MHPEAAIREQAERAQVEASMLQTDLSLDREVYDLMVVDDAEARISGLDDEAERVRNFALRDFRRAGVDREPEVRDRVRAINERLTELSQTFERNIRDDDTTVKVRPEQLDGLPQDWIDDHPVGDDGLVELTLEYPDVFPMLKFATDREARVAVHLAFNNQGWPANDEVLVELLALRQRARHAARVRRLADVRRRGQDDRDRRRDRHVHRQDQQGGRGVRAARPRHAAGARSGRTGPTPRCSTPPTRRYYLELVRREQHDVDAQEVRRYFSFERVRQGLLDVTGRLFGLDLHRGGRADLARRRHVVRRVARRPRASGGSTSTCTRARTSSTTRRSSP